MRLEREKQIEEHRLQQEAAKAEYLKRVEAERIEREARMESQQKDLELRRLEREAEHAKYQAEQEARYSQIRADLKLESEKRDAEWRASRVTAASSGYYPGSTVYRSYYHAYPPVYPLASETRIYGRTASPLRNLSPSRIPTRSPEKF